MKSEYTRSDLEEVRRRQDARWRESKQLRPVAGRSPTHFLTCGGYSAFICAPWLGAADSLALVTDFRSAVCAAVNDGFLISVGGCQLFDLANSHNPDLYEGCYVLRKDVAGCGEAVIVLPQEGVSADGIAACERLCRHHFNVVRMDTILTTTWLNSVAQDMVKGGEAPAEDDASQIVATSSDYDAEAGDDRPPVAATRRGR